MPNTQPVTTRQAVETFGVAGVLDQKGEVMAEPSLDCTVADDGQAFELPDGFAVEALGTAASWNEFPVPILGFADALRVCLHAAEDGEPYLCSPLRDGGFLAEGLEWQRRSTHPA